MTDSLKIKFVEGEHDRYQYSEIHTEHFSWIVDTSDFGVIHGLSRVVRLIPEKLVTARLVAEEDQVVPFHGAWLINLVLDLLQTFRQDYARGGPRIQRNQGLRRYHRQTVIELEKGLDVEEDVGLDLRETLDALNDSLSEAYSTVDRPSSEAFWQASREVVTFADRVREICFVYLELVHPFLVRARRLLPEEEFLQDRRGSVKIRLEADVERLMKELEEVRRVERI